MKVFKTGAIAFFLLRILHLLAVAYGKPNDPTDKYLLDRQNFKFNFMGDQNMLNVHSGFIIMMGFILRYKKSK